VGTCNYDYAYEVFNLVNEERVAAGLSELVLSQALLDTAMLRAEETSVVWSHTRPNGESCFTAFPSGNWYSGENIAAYQITPSSVMYSWMNSSGHKANILSSNYKSIGIGCFQSNGETFWVQCFGTDTSDAVMSTTSNKTTSASVTFDSEMISSTAPLSISLSSSTLDAGKSTTVSAYWNNSWSTANLNNSSLKWKSSNTSVATVDSKGVVTAKGAGTATITATTSAGTYSASASVTVKEVAVTTVNVTSVTLNKSTLALKVGGTEKLTKTVKPTTATNKSVSWTSSDKSVATVNSSGTVTAVGAGTATITCKAKDGSGKKATCKVTVTKPVTSVSLNVTALSLIKGNSFTLTKTVKPSTATNKNVSWTSSDKSVATVDSSGKVTAVGTGTATITCKAKDGSGKKATCKVTVPVIKATGVSLNKTTLSLTVGKTSTLTKTVKPVTTTNKNVTWKSSNTSVAKVDSSGKVTAVGVGKATITCTTKDGSKKKATCTVTVTKAVVKATSVSLNITSLTLKKGSTVKLSKTVKPSTATNKNVTWKSSDTSVVTVDSTGKIKAVAAGTATITCTTKDGSKKKATCKVTVK
jgi:uncharacterized protein YjdB